MSVAAVLPRCSACGFESLAPLDADLCEDCHRIRAKYPEVPRRRASILRRAWPVVRAAIFR